MQDNLKRLLFYVINQTKQSFLMLKLSHLSIGLLGLLFLAACNEPGLIGSDLVEDEQVELLFTDTLRPQITTVRGDSVRVFSPTIATLERYLYGDFVDPLFGKSTGGLYFRMNGPGTNPGFMEARNVDSMVVIIDVDSFNTYGGWFNSYRADIFQLTEDIDDEEDYFSNSTFMTEMMPVGTSNGFTPGARDSITLIEPSNGAEETVRVKNQWRIKLDDAFVQDFFDSDTSVFITDSAFVEKYKGFYLQPTNETPSMLAMDFTNSASTIRIYYHQDDTTFRTRSFGFETLVPNFSHDYTNTIIDPLLNNGMDDDSLFFIQGLQGLEAKVTLPDNPFQNNFIISKAELEITMANLPDANPDLFPPPTQLMMYQVADDSTKLFIDDLLFVVNSSDFSDWFGGIPSTNNATNLTTYKFNIGAYLSKVWAGEAPKEVYIQVNRRWQNMTRAAFYGGNHSSHPAKINLFYSLIAN
jgi:hypothetical protein